MTGVFSGKEVKALRLQKYPSLLHLFQQGDCGLYREWTDIVPS
jgi:hypothetical protein